MDNKILKGVLLLRRGGNKYTTKEEQIAEIKNWFTRAHVTERDLDAWIDYLKEEL